MPKTKYPIFKCLHRGEKGFTLIELLIVVAILGIIAAVVIPRVSGFMRSGNVAAANTEAAAVKVACVAYSVEHEQGLPASSDDLVSGGYLDRDPRSTYEFSEPGTIDPAPTDGWAVDYGFTFDVDKQLWVAGNAT